MTIDRRASIPAEPRFPDFNSLLEVVGELGEDLEAEGLNLEVADRIYERGRQDGRRDATRSPEASIGEAEK